MTKTRTISKDIMENPNAMSNKAVALKLFKTRRELIKWELYDYLKQYISDELEVNSIWYDRMDKVFKSLIKSPAGNDKRYIKISLADYVTFNSLSDTFVIDLNKVDSIMSKINWEERLRVL